MHNQYITDKKIYQYRSTTYRFNSSLRLHSQEDAVNFVNERGIVFFWPISGINLPSLWYAAAGDRPVPNNHDDPGHITWRWKDNLLGKGKWYYAKVLRRKSTIISLKMIPNFFALSRTVYQEVEDIKYLYRRGILSVEEKLLFEIIAEEGPLDTISLRNAINKSLSGNNGRFNRAMELLQRDFRIVPCGISQNGRWKYSFIYQTVQSRFHEYIEKSKLIKPESARTAIIKSYFYSNGIGSVKEIKKIFHWEDKEINTCLNDLLDKKEIFSSALENGEKILIIPKLL